MRMKPQEKTHAAPSVTRGRLLIALAAVLWSLSGGFSKVLTKDTAFGLNDPRPAALAIATFRLLFAGLFLCQCCADVISRSGR